MEGVVVQNQIQPPQQQQGQQQNQNQNQQQQQVQQVERLNQAVQQQLNLDAVKTRAVSLYKAIARILDDFDAYARTNTTPKWQDILGQYSMVNLELFNIVDDIKKVSKAFVVHPKNVNAEFSTILPVMLSSKLLPEMEVEDNSKREQLLLGMQNLPLSSQIEKLKARIDMIGAACESAEKMIADMRKAYMFGTRQGLTIAPTLDKGQAAKIQEQENLLRAAVNYGEGLRIPGDQRQITPALPSHLVDVITVGDGVQSFADASGMYSKNTPVSSNNISGQGTLLQASAPQLIGRSAASPSATTATSFDNTTTSPLQYANTPAEFVSCLLKQYGGPSRGVATQGDARIMVCWKDIGLAVAPIFSKAHGCCTMLGPMNTELKPRKTVVQRRRTKPTESAHPEELDGAGEEEKTDTDKNMATMFGILRRMKRVRLESLILNRKSFAQTVENLFALSFLVKDGRAEINVDENGSHHVSPRNAPDANSVMSGEVAYGHFVFRFDFKDWKLMMDVMPNEEELMPHRNSSNSSAATQADPAVNSSQATLPTTPIRKLSRNRGRVVQEQSIQQESSDSDNDSDPTRANASRRSKRKLN